MYPAASFAEDWDAAETEDERRAVAFDAIPRIYVSLGSRDAAPTIRC